MIHRADLRICEALGKNLFLNQFYYFFETRGLQMYLSKKREAHGLGPALPPPKDGPTDSTLVDVHRYTQHTDLWAQTIHIGNINNM